jgi:hypothetical protein
MRSIVRMTGCVGVVAVGALLSAGVAGADKEKVRLTAAGRAAAREAVVRLADLGAGARWTGGVRKADLSSTMPCAGYRPKQSDLVLIGAAKTVWKTTGLQIASEAQVLKTPAMVRLDWKRTVLAPQVLPCLRRGLAKSLPTSQRFISLRQIAFPRLATYTRAYRALIDVTTSTATTRVMVDIALVGRGRSEITLVTTAALAAAPVVKPAEIRLARLLAARIRT